MRYRLAVFDFDGTLADSYPWFLGRLSQLADQHRFRRVEEHEVEALRGKSARQVIEELGVPLWKLPQIARQVRREMALEIDAIRLFPGVDQVLRELARQGVELAVVTSSSLDNVRRILGPETAALIRHYACGVALFGKGPKLRKILRASGVPAAEAIAIGDEIRDLEAARAEGIAFGAVAWGYTRPEALRAQGPEEMFAGPEEILARLGRDGRLAGGLALGEPKRGHDDGLGPR
ncbi:MAG TPA: HAD hydrolase-like protein [Thermoanaerobaculia bacterium]